MPNRTILAVILDGVGDRPHPDHDDRTPLEAARTPTLDALAGGGATGLIDPLAPGIVPGSGTGHLGLFDYDPLSDLDEMPSRGCIEALGLGIEPEPGRVAARGNFVTLAEDGTISDRRAGRFKTDQDQAEATRFIETMNESAPEGIRFRYHPRMGYRFVVLVEDGSHLITDTDPGAVGQAPLDPEPIADTTEARRTAARVSDAIEAASKAIEDHPINEERAARDEPVANRIVTRGMGLLERGTTLEERFGLTAAGIAGGNAYRGIANYVGMELVDVEGATGDLRTDYAAKVTAALEALERYDLVYLHIKSPDVCGENGDFEAKRDVLEEIDDALAPLEDLGEVALGLTGDHSTPCTRGSHSGDPVPLILSAPDGRVDRVEAYHERACGEGMLGRVRGGDFLRSLLDMADRTKKTE